MPVDTGCRVPQDKEIMRWHTEVTGTTTGPGSSSKRSAPTVARNARSPSSPPREGPSTAGTASGSTSPPTGAGTERRGPARASGQNPPNRSSRFRPAESRMVWNASLFTKEFTPRQINRTATKAITSVSPTAAWPRYHRAPPNAMRIADTMARAVQTLLAPTGSIGPSCRRPGTRSRPTPPAA